MSFAQDSDRVRALLTALARLRGANPIVVNAAETDRVIKKLPYAVTETKFEAPGFERRTRSPLGQFGNIVSLLAPDSAN